MADFTTNAKGVRHEWRLRLPALSVGEAAQNRKGHHDARREWWQGQQAEAERDLRENGAELREQPVTGGNRLQMVLDPTKTQRVEECRSKVESHQRRAAEYAAFIRALELLAGYGDGTVEVGVGDIEYFGL